jgi:hypothetical protein
MKTRWTLSAVTAVLVGVTCPNVYPQSYNTPLTIHSFNHTSPSSAVSRAMGGLTLASHHDVSTMFSNPAALQTLEGPQFSVGGFLEYKTNEQTQRWYSLDWMSMFDLFMEGKTADLPDPVIDTSRVHNPTYQDSVQRNGRNPNWSRKSNQSVPLRFFAAMPFMIGETRLTVGVGISEYANVNYYYANKTAFNRNLDYITLPISTDPNPVRTDWWGDTRAREGSIPGYGGALSATIVEDLSVGISGMYFSGTIEDRENREGYGQLYFFSKDFRYTPNPYGVTWQGTSTVSGLELTFSSIYRTQTVVFGFSLSPPTSINRDYTRTGDSTNGTSTVQLPVDAGSDKLTLPWRGSIGVGIHLRSNVFLGADYAYKPYGSAEYTDKNGIVTKPWLDCSSFHFGVEYLPVDVVSVRFGYQTTAEVFEQQGNALHGDPIAYTVYSAGVGLRVIQSVQVNVGYEYRNMQYEDNWNLNTNINTDKRHTLFANIAYTLH